MPRNICELQQKFRGVLLGALIGDCVGLKYEGFRNVSLTELTKHVFHFQTNRSNTKLVYSDDSAMTGALARALLRNKNAEKLYYEIAKSFQDEFIEEPDRGYGPAAYGLLPNLVSEDNQDPFIKAKALFNGSGSLGNGAAMRVSPVALYRDSIEDCIKIAKNQARITHSHVFGINGSLFQLLCIKLILTLPKEDIDAKVPFLDKLSDHLMEIENEDVVHLFGERYCQYYVNIIETIKRYLLEYTEESLSVKQMSIVRSELGNEIVAHRSVPLCLFIFLFTLNKDTTIHNSTTSCDETLPPFSNAILNAIMFGGDTDTIASMCGALCGAYYGQDGIPTYWVEACESSQVFIQYADDFYNSLYGNNNCGTSANGHV